MKSLRNANFTESIIRRMTRIAIKYDAINLAQGFPDFNPPKEMTDRLEEISAIGPHQYPITMGALNFREALAKKCEHFMQRKFDVNTEMVVTIGSTEAMLDSLFAITNPGDKVVLFSPYFESYVSQIMIVNCTPIFVPLVPPTYNFDPNVLEDAFKQGAKVMILCNPSNPTGRVFTLDELEIISELCIKYDVFVITDEVYEHIIYEGNKHIYMSSLPNMWERTLSCSSLSKTYSITGWRLGYVLGPKHLIDCVKQYHDFVSVGSPSPLMEAAVVGLTFPDSYYVDFINHYTHMKNLFANGLKDLGFTFTEPQGTYFLLVDISKYLKKNQTDLEFCEACAEKVGVAFVPGSSFFKENINHIVRMHFAKQDKTLFSALDRLSTIKQKLDI